MKKENIINDLKSEVSQLKEVFEKIFEEDDDE